MMTREHRQEALSRAYVQTIAAQAGVLCSKPDPDYGIDLSLREVEVRGERLWEDYDRELHTQGDRADLRRGDLP